MGTDENQLRGNPSLCNVCANQLNNRSMRQVWGTHTQHTQFYAVESRIDVIQLYCKIDLNHAFFSLNFEHFVKNPRIEPNNWCKIQLWTTLRFIILLLWPYFIKCYIEGSPTKEIQYILLYYFYWVVMLTIS